MASVTLGLVGDVGDNVGECLLTEGEHAIFRLLGKVLNSRPIRRMAQDMARRSLDPADQGRDSNARWNRDHEVTMVRHDAHGMDDGFARPARSPDRSLHNPCRRLAKQRLPPPRCPNDVIEQPPVRHLDPILL